MAGAGPLNSIQPSPAHVAGIVTYENGVRAAIAFGTEIAPRVLPDTSNNRHKRIQAFGEHGFVHWRYESWERYTPEGGYEGGDLSYGGQDVLGQAGLTEAVFDWLEDESKVHPTHLAQSLAEFNLLLGIYQSALTHAPVELPFEPPNGLLDSLKELLG